MPIERIAFSDNGKTIAELIPCADENGNQYLWDCINGKLLKCE